MNRYIEIELYHQYDKVSVYTFRYLGDSDWEFDKFLDQYDTEDFKEDLDIILTWLRIIGKDGAHDRHFRRERGALKALPVETSKLRLYIIKISENIILIGNGGHKTTQTFNEDPVLNAHAINLESIGKILFSQIKNTKVSIYQGKLYGIKEISFKAI